MIDLVSHSELATFRQCPLRWQLAYEQRWTQDLPEDDRRALGTAWHLIMEKHYEVIQAEQTRRVAKGKSWRVPPEAERALLRRCAEAVGRYLYNVDTGRQSEVQALLEWMYLGYVNMWGADLGWRILRIEDQTRVPLPSATGGRSNRYVLRVQLDLLIADDLGHLWLVDHKSGRDLPKKRELDIDDQFGLYTWAMRQTGQRVLGAIHSAARTQRNVGDANGTKPMLLSERFLRTPMFRSDIELDNLALDAARTARARAATRRAGPVHSSPDPMTCRWKCEFLDAHLAMRKGVRPAVALKDAGLHQAEYNHTNRP